MRYRDAWAVQEEAHAAVLEGAEERLLLVEHPPVITFGRRPNVVRNMVATEEQLGKMGVEVVQSDRGGDITFHGPGQLVAYPIVRLIDHRLSVGGYVKALERVVMDVLAEYGIASQLDPLAIGVWTEHEGKLAKICALGVRIRRGISMHGIALNLTTDLRYFNLIVPCGLTRPVTSMSLIMGDRAPTMEQLKQVMARQMRAKFE
jgi:lipoate-protein ligase B